MLPDDDALLDLAIAQSRQDAQLFPYKIFTRSGEIPLPMVTGYTKQLWVERATRHPHWFLTLIHLRTLFTAVAPLCDNITRSFRPSRASHLACSSVITVPTPSDIPCDVKGKQAWQIPVPANYNHAIKGPHSAAWYASMHRELDSLIQRNTWTEDYIPPGVKAIATKWVYNVKSSLLFKSRLVARGDQRPSTNTEPDSDSPTLSRFSLNTLFAVGQALGWHMHALDVDCAYLYGDVPDSVKGKVWLQLPQGMEQRKRSHISTASRWGSICNTRCMVFGFRADNGSSNFTVILSRMDSARV